MSATHKLSECGFERIDEGSLKGERILAFHLPFGCFLTE